MDAAKFDGACSSVELHYMLPLDTRVAQVSQAIIDCYDSGGTTHICDIMDVSVWESYAAVYFNQVEDYLTSHGRPELVTHTSWDTEYNIYIHQNLGENICFKYDQTVDWVRVMEESKC